VPVPPARAAASHAAPQTQPGARQRQHAAAIVARTQAEKPLSATPASRTRQFVRGASPRATPPPRSMLTPARIERQRCARRLDYAFARHAMPPPRRIPRFCHRDFANRLRRLPCRCSASLFCRHSSRFSLADEPALFPPVARFSSCRRYAATPSCLLTLRICASAACPRCASAMSARGRYAASVERHSSEAEPQRGHAIQRNSAAKGFP